ncbi:MAG: acireductone synthase [Planctomycetes bacterium]|nr:acireductone synthase [Planctomycetota bacterium]
MTRAVLLDIEGTTTSISFVFNVLFPYAAANIPRYLATHTDAETEAACVVVLADATPEERILGGRDAVVAVVRRQMAGDVKAGGLKQLQGLVWKHGYESGAIRGQVYADVPEMLRAWKAAGREAAIYSSGSRLAQELLFRHSEGGDLTPLLAGYYDTTSGPKREASSYRTIADAWKKRVDEIVFCTDQPGEAEAARGAGMPVIILMRPGNAPLPANLPFEIHADLRKV